MGRSNKQHILLVDDMPTNMFILEEILKRNGDYEISAVTNGPDAIRIARSDPQPDLILLDIKMPEMDGYEVCAGLKESELTQHIPIIFVTARSSTVDEAKGFALGAVDYITKPISAVAVMARVKTHLALQDQNRVLEEKVRERTIALSAAQDVAIRSLAILAEYRDKETGGHIIRTQHYVRILAQHLKLHPRFCDIIGSDGAIDILFKSTPLHDVGKVGIPDRILLKPGRLTEKEFTEMKRHSQYGGEALERAESSMGEGGSSSFLSVAREIALTHHEKFDGSGYPNGLKGDAIPIPGRLMAIADIYDALVSRRVYKPPFSHEKACSIITEGDGRVEPHHFDPDVLRAFKENAGAFREISRMYSDAMEIEDAG